MTPTEMRHVLEAAYHAVFPGSTSTELARFEFGIAVGIVLGNLPQEEFNTIDDRALKAIVKNLAKATPSNPHKEQLS